MVQLLEGIHKQAEHVGTADILIAMRQSAAADGGELNLLMLLIIPVNPLILYPDQ